ncbi:MAG: hypothetical protein M1608_09160, partial [Candidatus Omnitrophica bacterium]|nr:hypothetical protein [Candidatus Omnitrophota bacterium]
MTSQYRINYMKIDGHLLRRRFKLKQLLMFLVFAVLLPVFLVQLGVFYRWYHWRLTEEMQANLELARTEALAFEGYVEDIGRQELIIGEAMANLKTYDTAAASRFLKMSASKRQAIRAVYWAAPDGRILASSYDKTLNAR